MLKKMTQFTVPICKFLQQLVIDVPDLEKITFKEFSASMDQQFSHGLQKSEKYIVFKGVDKKKKGTIGQQEIKDCYRRHATETDNQIKFELTCFAKVVNLKGQTC